MFIEGEMSVLLKIRGIGKLNPQFYSTYTCIHKFEKISIIM